MHNSCSTVNAGARNAPTTLKIFDGTWESCRFGEPVFGYHRAGVTHSDWDFVSLLLENDFGAYRQDDDLFLIRSPHVRCCCPGCTPRS